MTYGFGQVSAKQFKNPLAFSWLWRKSSGERRNKVGVVGRSAMHQSNCFRAKQKGQFPPQGYRTALCSSAGGRVWRHHVHSISAVFNLSLLPVSRPMLVMSNAHPSPTPSFSYFPLPPPVTNSPACSSSLLLQSPHSSLIQSPSSSLRVFASNPFTCLSSLHWNICHFDATASL